MHSPISPSSASVWMNCPGSVRMQQLFPQSPGGNEAAEEGALAHAVAESIFTGRPMPEDPRIDDEMLEGVGLYVQDVMSVSGDFGGVEHPVRAPSIHVESFGTLDRYRFDSESITVYLWDFKYGRLPVDAYENWQLINYAAGLVGELGFDGHSERQLTVVLRIVQPRHYSNPIKEWRVNAADLRPYWNRLANGAQAAMQPSPATQTGVHCRYCSARHACPAAIAAGVSLYEAAGESMPLDASPEHIGQALRVVERALEQLGFLKTAYEAQVEQLISSGTAVPGWAVTPTRGREKWTMGADEVMHIMATRFMEGAIDKPVNSLLLKPAELVTPNQARKLGVDTTGLTERPSNGYKIVPASQTDAHKAFTRN